MTREILVGTGLLLLLIAPFAVHEGWKWVIEIEL